MEKQGLIKKLIANDKKSKKKSHVQGRHGKSKEPANEMQGWWEE